MYFAQCVCEAEDGLLTDLIAVDELVVMKSPENRF